jgi:hypothetical protein
MTFDTDSALPPRISVPIIDTRSASGIIPAALMVDELTDKETCFVNSDFQIGIRIINMAP